MAERDVLFRIGEQEYGLDVQVVTAIEPMMDIVPVPNAPECVLGLMNLRGEVIPVCSLRKRFQLEKYIDKDKMKLIVAKYDEKPIAFKVDEVLEMHDFADDTLSATPVIARNSRTAYVRSVGKLVLLLEPGAMYEGDEEEQMAEVLKLMQEQ